MGRAARPRLDGGYYVRTRENRPLIGKTPVAGRLSHRRPFRLRHHVGLRCRRTAGSHSDGHGAANLRAAFSLARYEDPEYVRKLESWDGER